MVLSRWFVTSQLSLVSTLAQSYVDRAATGVAAVAEMAAERKAEKYPNLSSNHIFQPIAMENLGAFGSSSLQFLRELGRKLGKALWRRARGLLPFPAPFCCNTTI